MKGPAAALGGIAASATLAIGFSSTAHGATGHPTTAHATFNGCSATQQDQVNAAASAAQQLAAGGYSYARSHTSATPRYTTWFGAYTPARHSTVVSHFAAISQTQFAALTYDCTCQQDAEFGSVDPAQADRVVLCPAFWRSPLTGTDSKAGRLVNLVGRFTKTGGNKDAVQGQSGCQTLAHNNPASAVNNAASHEYFAENTPPLA